MRLPSLVLACLALTGLPTAAPAQERGPFAGLDVSVGATDGSSSTTDGGAPFAGGGVVEDVDFGATTAIGGHLGYRFSPATSIFLSYQHLEGDVGWRVDFPLVDSSSKYDGSAVSDAVMANVAYERPLSDRVAVRATAGAGVTFNKLSDVVETDVDRGVFLADVATSTRQGAVARVGAGLRYRVTPRVALGLDASIAYFGGFETGDTRSGNLGITDIVPYEIDDVWRTSLGVSIGYEF